MLLTILLLAFIPPQHTHTHTNKTCTTLQDVALVLEQLDKDQRAALHKIPEITQLYGIEPEEKFDQTSVGLIKEISSKWEQIASSLHFEDTTLQEIAKNNPQNHIAAFQTLLELWRQGSYNTRQPVTWETLIRSLYETKGFKAVADKLIRVLTQPHNRKAYVINEERNPQLYQLQRMEPLLSVIRQLTVHQMKQLDVEDTLYIITLGRMTNLNACISL